MDFNEEKLKALVHYICYKAHDPSILGAIKLNKILWHSDILSYRLWNKPITGETYIKRQYGPVSKNILRVVEKLVNEGAIITREVDYYGYSKKEYIALAKPNISLFTADEISLVDEIFDYVCKDNTATSISEKTHDDIWKLAIIGEEIPYYTILASKLGEINESDIEWAKGELKNVA